MKVDILMESKVTTGTNCENCKFTRNGKVVNKVEKDELNKQGGLLSTSDHDLKLAKEADLVTLPGKATARDKVMCTHPKVDQFVNARMCCKWWDGPGTYREWKD